MWRISRTDNEETTRSTIRQEIKGTRAGHTGLERRIKEVGEQDKELDTFDDLRAVV